MRGVVRSLLALTAAIWIPACSMSGGHGGSVLQSGPVSSAKSPATGHIIEYQLPTPNAGPIDIIKGPDGALWFTEAFTGKIGRIDVNGNITEFALGNINLDFMAVGPDSDIWLPLGNPDVIGRFTTGGTLTDFAVPQPSVTLEDIARGPDDRMWFVNIARIGRSANIDAIDMNGAVSQYGPVEPKCYFPLGITKGADGNMWFAGGQCLTKVTISGQMTSLRLGPKIGLTFVIAARDGDLWATDNAAQGPVALDQITYGAAVTRHKLPPGTGELYGLREVDGQIYFAELGSDAIGRIDESTFHITKFPIPTPNAMPAKIALGPDSNIWFTEFNADKIGVLVLH